MSGADSDISLEQKLIGAKHLSEHDLINEGLIQHIIPTAHIGGKELCVYYYPKTNQLFFFKHPDEDKQEEYEFWWAAYKQ
jgi:hypothetical protein